MTRSKKTTAPDASTKITQEVDSTKSLSKALAQNEVARELVQGAADELSSVNKVLTQEFAERDAPLAVGDALDKSVDIEAKVHNASDKLSAVNRALKGEVRDRVMLDHQFAAITERAAAARYDALHDPLTGLPNRLLFNDRLEHGLAQAERHGWNLAVMFVDLDKFKEINDSLGHDVGDAVLRTIAARMKEHTRADDTICRHGGDEFLYLLMETRGQQDVRLVAEKLIHAVEMPCDIGVSDNHISPCVSASIGIAQFPKDGTTADLLIRSADVAMYRAKQSKSGYAFAS